MSEQALQLIAENKSTKATFLDLGNCGLNKIPEEVFELVHLEGLNLGTYYYHTKEDGLVPSKNEGPLNYFTSLNSKLQQLTQLQSFSLKEFTLDNLEPLLQLKNLRYLYLEAGSIKDFTFSTNLTSLEFILLTDIMAKDFTSLANLKNLRYLSLTAMPIKGLTFLKGIENLQWFSLSQMRDLNRVLDLSILKDLQNLERLNLSNIRIQDITVLGSLEKLEQLDLSHTRVQDITGLGNLEKLEHLDLSHTRVQDITGLGNLEKLEHLDLIGTGIQDITGLGNLEKLEYLDLRGTGIQDITRLGNLQSLEWLNLSHTRIQDITVLGNLENLKQLHLSARGIQDITVLGNLEKLEHLDLSHTEVQNVTVLGNLQNLERLNLSHTRVQDIIVLGNLKKLEHLYLGHTRVQDITVLGNLQNLRQLDLSHTRVQNITVLENLEQLEWLDLRHTQIQNIESLIDHLKRGLAIKMSEYGFEEKGINVYNTPLVYPPIEVVKEGRESVLNYFDALETQGGDCIYEAKLLIVGKGGAGKTSLAIKLENEAAALPKEEDTTKGIDIKKISFPCKNDKDFTINIWDFGGQEIYHATHQFFLTKRSLYVLLDDTREDDKTVHDGVFRYWLEVVRLFGGNSPLLIVQNEKGDRSKDIDLKGMQGQFEFIKDKLCTNLATNRGLEKVKAAIQYHMQQLPHIGDVLPKKWSLIRQNLTTLALEKPHISLNEYYELCHKHGIVDKKKASDLSGYLHNLGHFLHFQENGLLKRLVILQNKWATDAVYRVLDHEGIKANKGYFSEDQLTGIWSEPRYEDYQPELLALMLMFELCYELEKKGHYLIPQLLPESRPESFSWSEEKNLQLEYHYKFMPKGLLSRLIVRMNKYIKNREQLWKNGAVLTRDKTSAFVSELYGENKISLRAIGQEPREFIVLVAEAIEDLNGEFEGIICTKRIPCICTTCLEKNQPEFYDFKDVQKFRRKGNPIQCRDSGEMVDTLRLIDNISNFKRETQKKGAYEEEGHFSSLRPSIHINNYLQTPSPQEKDNNVRKEEEVTVKPKKIYEQWWCKNILAGVGAGIFVAICSFWFDACHPFTGFLVGFGIITALLFLKGNPERRFFRAARTSFFSALSVFALQFGFSYRAETTGTKNKTQLLLEWLSEYDWLISLALILLSFSLFYLDFKKTSK